MSDSVTLPPEVIALHDACARILKKLEGGMDPSGRLAGPFDDHEPFDIVESDVLSIQLQRLEDVVNHLVRAVEELGEAMEVAEYDTATVYSVMGRVEAHVEILHADCLEVAAWRVSGEDLVARDLMTAIYRHTLKEIRLWLEEAIAALVDPITAMAKRGVDLTEQYEALEWATEPDSRNVEIPLSLKLTGAPELSDLTAWMEGQVRRRRTQVERQEREQIRRDRDLARNSGCLYGAVFGWLLGSWGNDD